MWVSGSTVMCVDGAAVVVSGAAAAGAAKNVSAAPDRSASLTKIVIDLVEHMRWL